MRVFEVPQISMRMPLMERASKTDQENGMVCHVSTSISEVTGNQKSKYFAESAIFRNFSDF